MRRRRFLLVALCWATMPCAGFALGPQVVESRLPNGARLLVSEQHNLPLVVVEIMLAAGARLDPPARSGVANLAADLLTEGTATRSATAFKEAVDSLGASLGAGAEMDYAGVELRILKDDLDVGLSLLADVLLNPVFAEAELARRREAVLAEIQAQRDDPNAVAQKAFRAALFGDTPYGRPVEGTEASVPKITRADVRAFYARHYRPADAIVVVVGDVNAADVQAQLTRAFASWRGEPPAPPPLPPVAGGTQRTVRVDKPVTQAAIVLGHLGIARNHPDYETLMVMNYTLGGGGFSARLMDSIRTQAGLAYGVSSFFTVNKDPGAFEVVMQTKNASIPDAIARARGEVERLRNEGVTEEELSEAKRYLTGSFPLRLDSNTKVAQFLGQVTFFDLGTDYADKYIQRVNAVTREDVQRVAREHLRPDDMIEVIVAPTQDSD